MPGEFTLTAEDERLLGRLVGTRVRQVVWDLNALYLVCGEEAIKVEVLAAPAPPGVGDDQYDEVMHIGLDTVVPAPPFRKEGEEGHWYTVVASDERIQAIEIARTMISYPGGMIGSPGRLAPGRRGVIADVGVMVTLAQGVVPAVLRENAFGFATWPEIRIYQREELRELLQDDYGLCSTRRAGKAVRQLPLS